MPTLDAVVVATEKLLSPAAPRVLALAGSREPKVEALREAVAVDPMLTVRVINHANHSFYARQVPVVSVRRALVRLGWKASRELLVRLLIEGAASRLPAASGEAVWAHATRVAALSRAIARHGRATNSELAYTAGLTHSLGVLGLLALHQDKHARLVTGARSNVHLAALEREVFGYDHAAVGSGVLARLALPEPMVMAVRWQYHARVSTKDWAGTQSFALAGTLQLCHRILAGHPDELPPADGITDLPLFARLGLDAERWAAVCAQYDADTRSAATAA